jgi:hypothetical protein
MIVTSGSPSPESLVILNALRDAVTQELEKKKRLGQYYVIWQDGRPLQIGDDAPQEHSNAPSFKVGERNG